MNLKLLSLNIEADKHLSTVKPFLVEEKADLVCLMEVLEEDLKELSKGYVSSVFAPNILFKGKRMGVAIMSKVPFVKTETIYCDGKEADFLPQHEDGDGLHRPVLIVVSINEGEKIIQVGATHFTWTQGGKPTEKQREDVERLMKEMGERELILCGDFNIPRKENELYKLLAEKYQDNIPTEITTTLDPHLHRINKLEPGKLAFVVDYMWSTQSYEIQNVRVKCGVSDHCAVVADIV